MKQVLLLLSVLIPLVVSAQEIEVVDSIDCTNPPIPQIPLGDCDSLKVRDITDRYGVVYKGGKCGIYDFVKQENVTRIEYSFLWYAFRKESEGEYFTYFSWEEPETIGVVGVAEASNQFISLSMHKIKDDADEGTIEE